MARTNTELTATQHRIRVRVLWATAVGATLLLGGLVIAAVDLKQPAGQTDAPFWRRLWGGFSTQLKSAGDELRKLRPAGAKDREIQDLERQVFPQFTK